MHRCNWVHHVDFYTNGTVGIERRGQETARVYQPTPASLIRLERATLMWRYYGATKQQLTEGLKTRAIAPMRRPDGTVV